MNREDKPVARSLRKPDKGRLGKGPATYTGGESSDIYTYILTTVLLLRKLIVHASSSCPLCIGRSIIFVAGGVSFAEMRNAYEVMEQHKKEVVIGGTSFLTPNAYVEQLRLIR